ncbi:MAG: glycosyltransferase family 2 protein [Chitinophagaceae bacterium]|nr:MAG: glycosyltransferase family 2 protein [Chitinophagaceae bacterium]
MNYPLVSVCMPAYNAEKYIEEALNSLLDQSYPNLEIVIVNDGSTDGTGEILNQYERKGVRVIHQENRGQCTAANTAFQHSAGEYIKFFDADDLLSKDFISDQVKKLNGSKDGIASASWGRFYGNDLTSFQLQEEDVYQDLPPMDWLVTSLEKGPNMMQCGLWLIPRNVLELSGLWDERLSLINDFDFFIRVILASQQVLFTENAILYYRSGLEQSLSGQKSRKALESAFLSTQLGVETILRYEDSARTRRICADAFQEWKYQFYPSQMDLYEKAENYVRKLGGSRYAFPAGGTTKLVSRLLGWKKTKKLKSFLGKRSS